MNAARIVRSFRMQLAAAPDKVFPLLCPTREYDWIEAWKCRMIHSDSGYAEPDCIFKTDFPTNQILQEPNSIRKRVSPC
jgi:hypothetical protein